MRIQSLFAIAALCGVATAQIPGPGLSWSGTLGGSTGSFLPSCTNLPIAALRNDSITLRVSGDMMAFYLLAAAPSGHQCTAIPGLGNALVLDLPIMVFAAGLLTQVTPCLACPPGYHDVAFTIPAGVPIGTQITFQAVSSGAGNPGFTVAITAMVQ